MATKSRASRAADQADQDQQQPEQCPHDLDPATCAECNGAVAAEREAEGKPEQAPELPIAAGDLGRGRIVYFQPSLTMPDGSTVECPHSQWGHGKESAAAACLRKLAAAAGVRVEVPES